jgi:hypothetical protein
MNADRPREHLDDDVVTFHRSSRTAHFVALGFAVHSRQRADSGKDATSRTRRENMTHPSQTEVKIPSLSVSRIGLLKSFASSLLILVGGAVAFSLKHPHSPAWVMSLVIAFVAVWSTKARLFVNGVAVEFTAEGLTDYTNGLGFVAWSEIVSAGCTERWFGEFIEFEVKDPDVVLARLKWLKRLMVKSNLRHRLPGFSINASWVSGGAEAILTNLSALAPGIRTELSNYGYGS